MTTRKQIADKEFRAIVKLIEGHRKTLNALALASLLKDL